MFVKRPHSSDFLNNGLLLPPHYFPPSDQPFETLVFGQILEIHFHTYPTSNCFFALIFMAFKVILCWTNVAIILTGSCARPQLIPTLAFPGKFSFIHPPFDRTGRLSIFDPPITRILEVGS